MEKIKVVSNLIELSKDDQLLTVDMKALVRVQRNKTGSEISLLGGDVIDVDQDYEDIVKAWAENDSIQQVIYSMPETTLCAVCNVVKRNHSKFTAKDVATEYLAHKEIYDESAKAQPKIRSDDETSDTLSYDTIIGGHKVHVTEYTKIE